MRELPTQLSPAAARRRSGDLVGAVLGKPPLRLTRRQALRARAQVNQETVDPLLRITRELLGVRRSRRS
jgi:hypothetical protein